MSSRSRSELGVEKEFSDQRMSTRMELNPSQGWRFWTCSIEGCLEPSAIDAGQCDRCRRHYCAAHAESSLHICERGPIDDATWTQNRNEEIRSLEDRVNNGELLRLASKLNYGARCWFDREDPIFHSMMGGMHIHLRIRFFDGSTWLARVLREKYTSFSDEFTNQVLVSEYATMKWLQKVDIPSPKIYGYGLRGDPANPTGLAFLLIDELPGTPYLLTEPTTAERKKVYDGIAEMLCKLKDHPFDRIGSLTTTGQSDAIVVDAVAGDRTGTLRTIGPFNNARHYYASICEEYLHLITERQLFTRFPVNAYLIIQFMKEMALCGKWNPFDDYNNQSWSQGPFFLKHMDDKGDHVLVDDHFNITGLIDWTFARIVPSFEAFGPSLFTADMSDLFFGLVRWSDQDEAFSSVLRARDEQLARFWDRDDRIRRLTLGLGMGLDMSWAETLDLWKGIITVLDRETEAPSWESWRDEYLTKYWEDPRLQQLLLLDLEATSTQTQ